MVQQPDAPGQLAREAEERAANNAIFFAVVFGSIPGMLLGALIAVVTQNPGLDALGGVGAAMFTVPFASWGVGGTVALAWDWVVGAITRTAAGTGRDSTIIVALGASAAAAAAFILVAQPLAVPVALLSIGLPVVWLAGALAWAALKYRFRRE